MIRESATRLDKPCHGDCVLARACDDAAKVRARGCV